jgi:tetratricopeptide (TPR) repeat protein
MLRGDFGISSLLDSAQDHYEKAEYTEALKLIDRCLTKNRRDGLKSKKAEMKVENSKELAMIRLLEGKINLALDHIEQAIDAYNRAKSSLVGIESVSKGIRGLIDYQFAEIAKRYKEHANVIELTNTSVNNLTAGEYYEAAIDYLFDTIDYISVNKLKDDPIKYTDQIDDLIKKSVKDKTAKKKYSAELSLLKGKFYKVSKPRDAAKEFENAAKEFASLKYYHKNAEAQVRWAELVRDYNLKKSEKILKEAISNAKKGDSDKEKGLVLVSLAKVNRILQNLEEAKKLEKEGFELLDKSDDKLEVAEYYTEMSRIIALTSTDDNELKTAVSYATKGSKLFDEIDHRFGKSVALFMQGFNRIAKGFDEGMSMIKLTTINIGRLRKNDQIEYVNTNAAVLTDVLTIDDKNTNLRDIIDKHQDTLHPLEYASLYHLASLIKYQTNKIEGYQLMGYGLELLEKFVKKNKEFRIYLDVARARKENMKGTKEDSDQTTSAQSEIPSTPSSDAQVPPTPAQQPKVVKKGGPDLSKM